MFSILSLLKSPARAGIKKYLKYQAILLLSFLATFFVSSEADARIFINEIMTGDKNSSKHEFIELYNSGNDAAILDKYKLTKKTASGNESNLVSSAKFFGTIPAKGYFVIAHPECAEDFGADLEYSGSSYSISDHNTVILYDSSGEIADLVGYGNASVFETAAAENPQEGQSIGRIGSRDTDDNSKDFFVLKNFSPGGENEKREENQEQEGTESEYEINELGLSIKIKHDKKTYPKIYDYFEAEISDANGKTLKLERIGKKYEYDCKAGDSKCPYPTLKFTWNFGDKHKSYLFSTKHKYEKTGAYVASLTVYDPESKKKTVRNFTVAVGKVPHPEIKIVAINANPEGKDSDLETITVHNKSKKRINLKGWSIATGWKKLYNHPILDDFYIKAGKKKEITRKLSRFTLNNKKAKIELRYPDGEVAHKVKYKKEKSIAEGEIYEKGKDKKWAWHNNKQETITKKQETNNIQNTNSEYLNINQNKEENIKDEEVGRQSKIIKKVLLLKAGPVLVIKDMEFEPYVFGEENLHEISEAYYFTPEYAEQKHYMAFFVEGLLGSINTQINSFLNYLKN